MTLAAGARLGPYEILAPLGAGGMGEVYRGKDTRLGREVAIKVLPEHLAADEDLVRRFEQEARAVAALSHPGILTLYDFGKEGGRLFAVMELLEGETLRTRLLHSTMPWTKAVEIGIAIADGVSAAHSRGIIHRDLKPDNIFLTADGRVKVLDFGLARWKPPIRSREETSAPTAAGGTEPGYVMGTTGYMSPEQVRGESVDVPSDIFSLGCILHESVSGRRPFQGKTSAETLAAILRDPAPELSELDAAIPWELSRIVSHCLEKEAGERFQSARDLAFALRAVQGGAAASKISSGRRRSIDSIAVLPLTNASGDAEAEYLSDGITETIIMKLSRLQGLRVMARTSVFRYKGADVDPLAAGRALNVGAILTGRVLHRGEDLLIRAELVDLADGSQLWGEQYSRKITDVLEIENEIASQISENLRLKLTGEEKRDLTRRSTESAEAYRLYLQGRFYWNKRTSDGLRRGMEFFRKAIEADPEYAGAYVGLADSYAVLGFWAIMAPADAFPKAKAAALRALEINPSLADARAPLGYVRHYYDWNWVDGEREYVRALEGNPNSPITRLYYGNMLTTAGRFEEALAQFHRAQELDPLSLIIQHSISWCCYFARRYDESIREARKTLEMDPTFAAAREILGLTTLATSKSPTALEELRKAVELSGGSTMFRADLGYAQAICGVQSEARETLDALEKLSSEHYVSSYYLAPIPLALGDKDRAFELLEAAFAERSPGLTFLRVDPRLDELRTDARFVDLLRRVGVPG